MYIPHVSPACQVYIPYNPSACQEYIYSMQACLSSTYKTLTIPACQVYICTFTRYNSCLSGIYIYTPFNSCLSGIYNTHTPYNSACQVQINSILFLLVRNIYTPLNSCLSIRYILHTIPAYHPALEPGYAMRDMIIAVGTRNMVTNPLSWSSISAVEPADKNKGFKSWSSLE